MPSSVLVVDPSAENREVLRTVLHQRGLKIYEADEATSGLALAHEHHPDVIVLDLDAHDATSGSVQLQLRLELDRESSSLIILGKLRQDSVLADSRVLSKPYHFAPLVHTIQELAAAAKAA
jgi:CheY-like chemotaxis protein